MTIPYDSDPNGDGFDVAGAAEAADDDAAIEDETATPEE